jgi:hypothetical protein
LKRLNELNEHHIGFYLSGGESRRGCDIGTADTMGLWAALTMLSFCD